MPGRTQGTAAPVLNACDCTPTPSSPVSPSRATIEYVTRPKLLLVHAHRYRPGVAGCRLLQREHAAPASVDEDRVLRVQHVGARAGGVRRHLVRPRRDGVREEE